MVSSLTIMLKCTDILAKTDYCPDFFITINKVPAGTSDTLNDKIVKLLN